MDMQKNIPLQGIASALLSGHFLSEALLIEYQAQASHQNMSLLQYIDHKKTLDTKKIATFIADFFSIPCINLDSFDVTNTSFKYLDLSQMIRYRMIPVFQQNNELYLATDDPCQYETLKNIQFHTGLHAMPWVVDAHQLTTSIAQLKRQKELKGLVDYATDIKQTGTKQPPNHVATEEEPVVHFIHQILVNAIDKNASDVHFEPYEHHYRIRYRQDGLLTTIATPPLDLSNRISARLKVMAHLDASERRLPQDGRFKLRVTETKSVDFRVNTCPTVNGEKIVLRLLDVRTKKWDIDALGFTVEQKNQFLKAIRHSEGMILVTGPTGSGKTITLYTALNALNTMDKNVSTIEDPVEITLSGINQVNINPKAGLTFSEALRAFLRQDPDVIMVGEVRDKETAEMAIKASHTGHLVLSTLHTNSAAETLTRLLNIGIPAFHIASSVRLIIAQRLIRTLCVSCRFMRTDLTLHDVVNLKLHPSDAHLLLQSYHALGCKHCTNGFYGRVALFEVMPISKHIARMIINGHHAMELEDQARSEGMMSMWESGLEKIKQGVTNIEEIQRVITC